MDVTLYSNRSRYPDYEASLPLASKSFACVELGVGGQTGTIKLAATYDDVASYNYMSYTVAGKTVYGWITGWSKFNSTQYALDYSVDSFRTWRDNITPGVQYIQRDTEVNYLPDKMLQIDRPAMVQTTSTYNYDNPDTRYMVVQIAGSGYGLRPLQPSPYDLYILPYTVQTGAEASAFMQALAAAPGRPRNLAGIYSVPYVDTSQLVGAGAILLDIFQPEGQVGEYTIPDDAGLYRMPAGLSQAAARSLFVRNIDIPKLWTDEIFRAEHVVQIVIPEAGIIKIPDELLHEPDGALGLSQSCDPYSGAVNYMLTYNGKPTNQSVRGTSLSAIPSLSDEASAYYNVNHGAINAEMMSNAATVVTQAGAGLAMAGPVGAIAGAVGGLMSFDESAARHEVAAGQYQHTAPAMSGSALMMLQSNRVHVVITRPYLKEPERVWARYGYPQDRVKLLDLNQRYVQTRGCNVLTDGTVPAWAIDEINKILDNGLRTL